MKFRLIIMLRLFLVAASTVGYCASNGSLPFDRSPQMIEPEGIVLSDIQQEKDIDDSPIPEEPVQESEDEDDNTKEKVFHRLASLHFTFLLEQRYLSQHLIFEQLRLEIDTPPPKIS